MTMYQLQMTRQGVEETEVCSCWLSLLQSTSFHCCSVHVLLQTFCLVQYTRGRTMALAGSRASLVSCHGLPHGPSVSRVQKLKISFRIFFQLRLCLSVLLGTGFDLGAQKIAGSLFQPESRHG